MTRVIGILIGFTYY